MIKKLSEQIDKEIRSLAYPDDLPNLFDPISYTLNLGGKRIRPLLTLLGARLFKPNAELAMSQAIGIEMFHNFTLVHDDIMDEAPVRRGAESVFKKWNSNTAILSGDVMFALAVQHISDCNKETLPQVLSCFLESTIKVCEGQQMDMDFENRERVELSEYVRMIELKTAWLLAGSLKIGAIVAGADERSSTKLFDFMMKAGTAFQLMDDYLDVYGDPSKFGKQVGGDIRSGKKTFLFLRSLERCGDKDRNRLIELYRVENNRGEEAVKEVAEIFNSCGASSELLEESESLLKSGLEILSQVKGDRQIMDEIINLTHQLIIREK